MNEWIVLKLSYLSEFLDVANRNEFNRIFFRMIRISLDSKQKTIFIFVCFEQIILYNIQWEWSVYYYIKYTIERNDWYIFYAKTKKTLHFWWNLFISEKSIRNYTSSNILYIKIEFLFFCIILYFSQWYQ